MKNIDTPKARRFSSIYKFIDDLIRFNYAESLKKKFKKDMHS